MSFASSVPLNPKDKDYYKILNVPTSATPEQIKESYRLLAKKHHPDARATEPEAER
jgi:DnaJ-class molecular chaperone